MLKLLSRKQTAVLTAVENKTPDASNLVKETDYVTKISDIESETKIRQIEDKPKRDSG